MSYKKQVTKNNRQQARQEIDLGNSPEKLGAEDLLKEIDRLLAEDSPQKALELISKSKSQAPSIVNATGVCQLRLGNASAAVNIYRRLLVTGGIFIRPDAPDVFKVNFALAMLMDNNYPGFYSTLAEVSDDQHPALIKVKAGLKAWKQTLPFWQRLLFSCGVQLKVPVEFSFPLGDLK
ncbi:hypothetical protein [Thalassoroseus pseudoceratinae]|uniref:hypothetical protein n=1 Tax=Thalassoroseus pseudoceratinae TaxID=2713176 RepID=UPI0014237DDD|nr:hypothetical protein [Thalassoroseus pseudoceratinae]